MAHAGAAAGAIPVSAVIISKNAETTIADTLRSLQRFAEVVVYDNGSEDRTLEKAAGFPNVSLHQGEFLGFGPTKNQAAGLASHDWIFSVDADERPDPELIDAIAGIDYARAEIAYRVLRVNYFRGKRVRFSGWSDDHLVRVYHRKQTGLTDVAVHEKVLPPDGGEVKPLGGKLLHETVRELSELIEKINLYSELRRSDPKRALSPPAIMLRSLFTFFRVYCLKLGFLDGWRGLVIAVYDANEVFWKYMKPYVDREEPLENTSSKDPGYQTG